MKKLLTMPTSSVEGTEKVAHQIFEDYLSKSSNFTLFLQGSLGAGKTFMVREILKLFGVKDEITSPTYALMQEYNLDPGSESSNKSSKSGTPSHPTHKGSSHGKRCFAHFDFYRLSDPQEFFARGFTEIAEDTNVSCFVEWGDKLDSTAQSIFSGEKYIIRIEHGLGVGMRKISFFEK